MIHSSIIEVRHLKAMSGSCHWAQSLNDQKDFLLVGDGNGVQGSGLGAGVLSVGRGMVHHFLRMKVCQPVDLILQDHTLSFLINIRVSLIIIKKKYSSSAEQNRWGRLQGTAGKCLVASAALRFFL